MEIQKTKLSTKQKVYSYSFPAPPARFSWGLLLIRLLKRMQSQSADKWLIGLRPSYKGL